MIVTTTSMIISALCHLTVLYEQKSRIHKKILPSPQSASELYRPSDGRLSSKLVPTFLRIEGATWSA
jgi:hypothetical protein